MINTKGPPACLHPGVYAGIYAVYIYIYIYAKSHAVYAKAYASVTVSKCLCLIFLIDFFTINKKNKGSEERGIVEDSVYCNLKETKEARRGEEPWRQASGRINANLGLRRAYARV